jgi:predicted RNase H-like HicB family nuclease
MKRKSKGAARVNLLRRYEPRSKARTSQRVFDHRLKIELDRENDGRWLAAVVDLPGVMAYGTTPEEASVAAEKIALRILLDRLEHQEDVPELTKVFAVVA